MTNANGTLKYRVEQLEKCYDKIDSRLDTLLTNHLPHIEQEIVGIKTRVTVMAAINVGALVVAIVVGRIL